MNNKGFSLIEVLVGLVILAIGLLAIAGMQITSIRGNYFSSSLTQATILAQDRMEKLKNLPYPSLSSGSDTETVSGTIFTMQWTVVPDSPADTWKTVTVTVKWTDRVDREIKLTTIRAK